MSYKNIGICLNFSLLLFSLQLFQPVVAQKKSEELGLEKYPGLVEAVNSLQKQLGNQAVILVSTDTVVFKKNLGSLNEKSVEPIASCSKWLTAALIMQLVDEGKLSLDDKVSTYIPIFSTYAKNYITIRNCLSHYTGIQSDPPGLLTLMNRKKFASLEEEVNDFAKREIQSNPGTEFRYSNIGLNIAARIAEIVTKHKFDMLIRTRLFVPLGMRQTTFSTLDGSAPNPSGGARSTAADYMHFLQMLLQHGKFNGQQILSEASVQLMRQTITRSEQIKYVPRVAEGYGYSLGSWVLEEGNNHQAKVLASPGLFGTFPYIDFCRNYACIIFVKTLLTEQKADADFKIKEAIDTYFPSHCKQ